MTLRIDEHSLNRCDKELNFFPCPHTSIFISQNQDVNSESEPSIFQM